MALFAAGGTISTYGGGKSALLFTSGAGHDGARFDPLVRGGNRTARRGIGTLGSTINPFATVIAANASRHPFTRMLMRVLLLIAGHIMRRLWVMRYARKVRAYPELSIVAGCVGVKTAPYWQSRQYTAGVYGYPKWVLLIRRLLFRGDDLRRGGFSAGGMAEIPAFFWRRRDYRWRDNADAVRKRSTIPLSRRRAGFTRRGANYWCTRAALWWSSDNRATTTCTAWKVWFPASTTIFTNATYWLEVLLFPRPPPVLH